jgi:hypothetical protein
MPGQSQQTFPSDLEHGVFRDDTSEQPDHKQPLATYIEASPSFQDLSSSPSPRWRRDSFARRLKQLLVGRSGHKKHLDERGCTPIPTTPLKKVLRLLALALMLL